MALTAFRAQQRWAWWTLRVGNTIAFAAPLSYDLTRGAIGIFEVLERVLLAAVYLALAARWPLARDQAAMASKFRPADLSVGKQ